MGDGFLRLRGGFLHVGQSSLHKVAVDDCLGRQSSLLSAAFVDCREPKRAVVFNDINSKLLKPRKLAATKVQNGAS